MWNKEREREIRKILVVLEEREKIKRTIKERKQKEKIQIGMT